MATNYYTRISIDGHGIRIFSTDTKLLDDIIAEVKKYAPACNASAPYHDIHNDKSEIWIDKLDGKDSEIGVWLLRWLGQLGWQIFEGDNIDRNFRLRKIE